MPTEPELTTIDDSRLDRFLAAAGDDPVLLYFTASWCGPCRVFGPRLTAYAHAHPDLLRVARVDADESPATRDRFRVRAFPSLVLVRRSEQLWLRAGALSEDELAATLPALGAAARALDGTQTHALLPDRPRGTGPRTARVPVFDDPRVTVRLARETVTPGAVVELTEPDGLRVSFSSDARTEPSCDLAILRDFEPGTVGSVDLQCSELTADHVRALSELEALTSLTVLSAKPLREQFLAALPSLGGLQQLYLGAPGVDLDRARAALPAVLVNFDWTAPSLAAHLPGGGRAEAEPPAPRLPAVCLAAPGPRPTIVLVEHPAVPVPPEVRAALAVADKAGSDVAVGEAVDADDPAVQDAYRFVGASELLLLHGGRAVARRDTCGPHHVDELLELADRAAHLSALTFDAVELPPRALSDRPRTVALDVRDAEALLVPPNSTSIDHVALRPCDPSVSIPARWSLLVRVEANSTAIGSLPSDEVDALELSFTQDSAAESIAALRDWPRLADLTVYLSAWNEDAVDALARLVGLRRLTVVARPPEGVDFEPLLRTALPGSVVNDEWTHPAFAARTSLTCAPTPGR